MTDKKATENAEAPKELSVEERLTNLEGQIQHLFTQVSRIEGGFGKFFEGVANVGIGYGFITNAPQKPAATEEAKPGTSEEAK